MGLINIGSSSNGNCFVIKDGEDVVVLDLGFTHEDTQRRYKAQTGDYFAAIGTDACFVTHRHNDHSRGIVDFLDHGAEIYAPSSIQTDFRLRPVKLGKAIDKYYFTVVPFPVIHKDLAKNMKGAETKGFYDDMVNIECFGYVLAFNSTQNIWLYMTDTSFVLPPLQHVNYAIIECNHDLEIVQNSSELHIRRALESHLSLQDLINILKNSDTKALRRLYLCHVSSQNLDILKAKSEIKKVFKGEIYFCKKNGGFYEI